jgi:uncharacterized protein
VNRFNPARSLLVWAVHAYQMVISPALPRSCKYHPSCSQYAIEALTEYGAFRGSVLAGWRLMRCNPLSYGGYDPVDRQKVFKARPTRHVASGGAARVDLSRRRFLSPRGHASGTASPGRVVGR